MYIWIHTLETFIAPACAHQPERNRNHAVSLLFRLKRWFRTIPSVQCSCKPSCLAMGNKIRPRKFGHPPTKTRCIAVARKKNAEHKKIGLHASTSEPSAGENSRLRHVDDGWPYSKVVRLSNAQAKKLLQAEGILPSGRLNVTCWQCGNTMSKASSSSSGSGTSDVWKCPECRTKSRHSKELKHASLAWTPFWWSACRGYELRFAAFVRVAHCVAYRLPQDAMFAYVNDEEISMGRDLLGKTVRQIYFACAFAEAMEQNDVQIDNDLVEADGARTAISKVTSKTKHLKRRRRFPVKKDNPPKKKATTKKQPAKAVSHGRLLLICARNIKQSLAKPLRPKSHLKSSHGAPETANEILPHIRKHVDSRTTVACSDSGKGLQKDRVVVCRAFTTINIFKYSLMYSNSSPCHSLLLVTQFPHCS